MSTFPRIVVPLGDPAGIGTEVVLKALASPEIAQIGALTLVGTRSLLRQTYQHLQQQQPNLALADPDHWPLLDVGLAPEVEAQICLGQGNAASGLASFRYLETAIEATLAGQFDGIVTAPIAKAAWQAAGYSYPGQTELLAERAGVERFGMLFVARSPYTGWVLRTLLATTHIPLRQVPDTLTPELMTRKLTLLIECLHQDFGIARPRIAIAGLNPHSGEAGQLGKEEQNCLYPWLQAMQTEFKGVELVGLVPPDTLWVAPGRAWYGDRPVVTYDAYLALYHDQGLVPLKLLAFDQAVNTTIGLPFVRTSPDHGTAFDIAGLGIANESSFKAAIAVASTLCQQRQKQSEMIRLA